MHAPARRPVAPATRSARFLTQNEAPMSTEEATARHVPVRRSDAAALTGGGGSMSRRRRGDDGERSQDGELWCLANRTFFVRSRLAEGVRGGPSHPPIHPPIHPASEWKGGPRDAATHPPVHGDGTVCAFAWRCGRRQQRVPLLRADIALAQRPLDYPDAAGTYSTGARARGEACKWHLR